MGINYRILKNYSRYLIYENAVIYDINLSRIIYPQINSDGYAKITLRDNNAKRKTFSVHRLVAELFIDNPEHKETVNHIDGIKTNNHYSNLEWNTRSENIQHAWNNGLIKDLESRKQGIYPAKRL